MNAHISKPIDVDTLYQTLGHYISMFRQRTSGSPPHSDDRNHDMPFLPGIDMKAGLNRVGGNRTLYKKLIIDFYNDTQSICEEVRKAIYDNNVVEAKKIIHGVKGRAGNISLTDLYKACEELEQGLSIKTRPRIEERISHFDRAWVKLAQAAAILSDINLDDTKPPDKPETRNDQFDWEEVIPQLSELASLLEKTIFVPEKSWWK